MSIESKGETVGMMKKTELFAEGLLFASRWLIAPVYGFLGIALLVIAVQAGIDIYGIIRATLEGKGDIVRVDVAELIDMSMFDGLVIICMFAGYENFVSRLDGVRDHQDCPKWLLHIGFHDIKKLTLGTMAVMGCVNLLKLGYMGASMSEILHWVIIVATLSFTAIILAGMEYLGGKHGGKASSSEAEDVH